jgi:hypothetical protein
MSKAEIFLEYHGPLDLSVIELLLKKLKKARAFAELNTAYRKRSYAMVVECLENIHKHAALKGSIDHRSQPSISAWKENDKIFIVAGNPVTIVTKDKLEERLNKIIHSDEAELKRIYNKVLTSDPAQNENGAGLGFISMAIKSGNNISYRFNPLYDSFLLFEIQIILNTNQMRKLILDQTSITPQIIFDPEKNVFRITGESRPPDVREFYDQILSWLHEFSIYLIKRENKRDPVIFDLNFDYFNSSSGKLILDICKVLAALRVKGIDISVNWYYENGDEDMLEVGKEMSNIVRFPFEYIETSPK